MYTEFDYKQALAVLYQMQRDLRGDYSLEVETIDTENSLCFDVFDDLFKKEDFMNPSKFSLIYTKFYVGEDELCAFYMGRKECKIVPFFDSVCFPKEIEIPRIQHSAWDNVLFEFIKIVKTMMDRKLKLQIRSNV